MTLPKRKPHQYRPPSLRSRERRHRRKTARTRVLGLVYGFHSGGVRVRPTSMTKAVVSRVQDEVKTLLTAAQWPPEREAGVWRDCKAMQPYEEGK